MNNKRAAYIGEVKGLDVKGKLKSIGKLRKKNLE